MVRRQGPVWLILAVLIAALYMTIFYVDQTEKALVLQFGEPLGEPLEPGFHLKVPVLHRVKRFDGRLLHLDAPRLEMLTGDKKTVLVDCYTKWEIADPLKYYVTVRERENADSTLRDVVLGELRIELGRRPVKEIIAQLKEDLLKDLIARVEKTVKDFGMHVVDVRLERIELPQENKKVVFESMRSERERQVKKFLAEGKQRATEIRAEADKEIAVIEAEAHRKAEEVRGRADAQAAAIYAKAFGQDPDFYRFTKTLELYRNTVNKNSTLFLNRDDELMELMRGLKLKP